MARIFYRYPATGAEQYIDFASIHAQEHFIALREATATPVRIGDPLVSKDMQCRSMIQPLKAA